MKRFLRLSLALTFSLSLTAGATLTPLPLPDAEPTTEPYINPFELPEASPAPTADPSNPFENLPTSAPPAEPGNPFEGIPTNNPTAEPSLSPEDTTMPEKTAAPSAENTSGTMFMHFNAKDYTLLFDPSEVYTKVANGYLNASFYTPDTVQDEIDLYIVLPTTAKTGDVYTPTADTSSETGFFVYFTDNGTQYAAAATQAYGTAFPTGSDYKITITNVETAPNGTVIEGTISATLAVVDSGYNVVSLINDVQATFSLIYDMNASPAPYSVEPSAAPAMTLPPNLNNLPLSKDGQRI